MRKSRNGPDNLGKEGNIKRIVIAVGVVVLVFGVAILARTQTGSAEQELIRLENDWADAWVKSDVGFNDRIMSDDFTWTSPLGKVWTKAQDIEEIKSGDLVIASWELADMKVRVYGDAAVVTGRSTVKETYKGQEISAQARWTHTWVKLAGRWQCVAAHSSRIAQK